MLNFYIPLITANLHGYLLEYLIYSYNNEKMCVFLYNVHLLSLPLLLFDSFGEVWRVFFR